MTRKEAREFMMQVYFQMEACGDFDVNNKTDYMNQDRIDRKQRSYCNDLYSLLCNKKDQIDGRIEAHCTGWKLSRMPKTDLAVLRLAACEILYLDDILPAVSINEAVELAKKYGTDASPKYVNAILGKIAEDAEIAEDAVSMAKAEAEEAEKIDESQEDHA